MFAVHRALLATIAGLAASVITATSVAAATHYQDTVSGYEVYATDTEGVFAGSASGALPGYWEADVLHTPLSGTPQTATITGGSFNLLTNLHSHPTLITGAFSGGSVVQTAGFSGCVNQVYQVTGQLTSVGVYGRPGHGTGTFGVTLTHHRISIGGYCVVYAATIAGAVALDFLRFRTSRCASTSGPAVAASPVRPPGSRGARRGPV
jgi:hypothetical protein